MTNMHGDLTEMREIQRGGGFISFDVSVARFGLGSAEMVESLFRETVVPGPLEAGREYVVSRGAS